MLRSSLTYYQLSAAQTSQVYQIAEGPRPRAKPELFDNVVGLALAEVEAIT
jgi:hypothetical protein